jgi:uncharacterized phage protein (TIGR02218 family)
MTYAEREESIYEGNPVELYQFLREDGKVWRYTSADENQTYAGNLYTAIPIQRDEIEASQDIERASLKVEMPSTIDFAQQFISEPPFIRYSLTMWRYHVGDSQVVSLWIGRVINVLQKESTAEVLCESSQSSLKRTTLRRLYQKSCPHVLYGDNCRVDKSLFETLATVSGVSGLDIISAQYAIVESRYFLGGYVEITKNGDLFRRFITNHVGPVITVNLPIYGLSVGDILTSYPGCNHGVLACKVKFNNIENYGGFPWIPDKNPMGTVPIF